MLVQKPILALLMVILSPLMAMAQAQYLVKPGDTIRVEVLEDNSLNRAVVVLPDGRFSFPFAGTLPAAGRTVEQIESSIATAISPNFAAPPTVFASIQPGAAKPKRGGGAAAPATIDIYFMGEVKSPGLKKLERGTTFLQAMALSGGFSKFAATKRVQLRRINPTTGQVTLQSFNYKAISNGGIMTRDPRLRDGDVILVPERRLFE